MHLKVFCPQNNSIVGRDSKMQTTNWLCSFLFFPFFLYSIKELINRNKQPFFMPGKSLKSVFINYTTKHTKSAVKSN